MAAAASVAPIFKIVYDRVRGFLHAFCSEFWMLEDVANYRTALLPFIREAHANFGFVRVLVDRRGCPVQSPEVVDRTRAIGLEVFREHDRFALVVDSALVRMQVNRIRARKLSMAFDNIDRAKAWLFEED